MRKYPLVPTAAGLLLATTGLTSPAVAVEIGSVAAANERIDGTPPDADPRILRIGERVVQDELVQSSEVGSGQFLFLDQTSLTISPNSEVVLDRYVYDPDRQVGEIALSVSKGALRFIGGKITKTGSANITTPQAAIAIRGGIGMVRVDCSGGSCGPMLYVHVFGQAVVNGTVLTESGTGVILTSQPGMPAGRPQVTKISPEQVASVMEALQSGVGDGGFAEASAGPGGTAAGLQQLTDEQIEEFMEALTELNSGNQSVIALAPLSSATQPPPAEDTEGEAGGDDLLESDRSSVVDVRTSETTQETIAESSPPPDPEPEQPPTDPEPEQPPTDPEPEPPVDPEPEPPAIQGSGVSFQTTNEDYTDKYGSFAANPAEQNVVLTPEDVDALTRLEVETVDGTPTVFIEDPDVAYAFPAVPGFQNGITDDERQQLFYYEPFDGSGFFALAAETLLLDGMATERRLFFGGQPTPQEVFRSPQSGSLGPDPQVRFYDIGLDLHGGFSTLLPPGFESSFANHNVSELFLISQPEVGFLPGPAPTGGGWDAPDKFAKAGLATFSIEGAGPDQRSQFGVLTGKMLENHLGLAFVDISGRIFMRTDSDDPLSHGYVQLGTVPDSLGNGFYGPDGELAVLGSLEGPAFDGDELAEYLVNGMFVRDEANPGQYDHSTTRLMQLDRTETVLAGERIRNAMPIAETRFADTANSIVTDAFSGGFAAANGQSRGPGIPGYFSQPYLLFSDNPGDVRLGFGPAKNAALAEFGAMQTIKGLLDSGGIDGAGGTGVFDVRLNFGSGHSRDAFIDENTFLLKHPFCACGQLTGQIMSVSGLTGRPPAASDEFPDPSQSAFRSAMASSGAVGDGGIFPDGTDTESDNMVWGWWAGEFRFDSNPLPDVPEAYRERREHFDLGSFITGTLSDQANVAAATAQTSFAGFALAHINELLPDSQIARYVDGGTFQLTYDFGTDQGSAVIDDILGGGPITATVVENVDAGHHYSGALREDGAAIGQLFGAFFSGAGSSGTRTPETETASTAGRFHFERMRSDTGNRQQATGIFGADRDHAATPLPVTTRGISFRTTNVPFTGFYGTPVENPAEQNVVLTTENIAPVTVEIDDGRVTLRAGTEFEWGFPADWQNHVQETDEFRSFRHSDDFGGKGLFALAADDWFSSPWHEGTRELQLAFAGTPTPQSVFRSPHSGALGPDIQLREYTVSPDLHDGRTGFLPAQFDVLFPNQTVTNFTMISEPEYGFLRGPGIGSYGAVGDGHAKTALAVLGIEGAEENQRSVLSVHTGILKDNEAGAPFSSGGSRLMARLDATDPAGFGSLVHQNLPTSDGFTFFGPNGDVGLFGNVENQYDSADDIAHYDADSFIAADDDDAGDLWMSYGTTRLLELQGISPVAADTRLAVSVPIGETPFSTDNFSITHATTGGFAASNAQARLGPFAGPATYGEPYLVQSDDVGDVRFGFDPGKNRATAEFATLQSGNPEIRDVNLNFGDNDSNSRSAMVTDRKFLLRDTNPGRGALTGQKDSVSGIPGRGSSTDPNFGYTYSNSLRASVASSEFVGDGGIFPAGTDTRPEHLSWGYWNAEFRFNDSAPPEYQGRRERFHLGSWVTGVVADAANVNAATGVAGYDGFAVAHINETRPGGEIASYVDGGRFSMRYDFGTDSGTVNITNITGGDLRAPVSAGGAIGGHHYGGSFANGGVSGGVQGAFFAPGATGQQPNATAGRFDFERARGGGVQSAAGIFAGDRSAAK